MLPLILAAARAALPSVGRAVAGRAAAGTAGRAAAGAAATGGASRLLSGAQFGAGMVAGSHSGDSASQAPAPASESNPVYNR